MTSKFILHSLVSLCLSTLFLASSSFVVAAEKIDKLIVEKIKDIGYATVILPPRFTLQIKSGEAFGLGKLSKNVDCSGFINDCNFVAGDGFANGSAFKNSEF